MLQHVNHRILNRLAIVLGFSLILLGLFGLSGVYAAGGVLTWSDGTTQDIYQVGIDGTGATQIITDAANTLLDVDTDGTYLYWVENNSLVVNYIGRSDFDGTSPSSSWLDTSVVGDRTWGIAVDDTHIYWTDTGRDSIHRANIDGTGATEIISLTQAYPSASPNTYDITVDDTSIYWTDGTEDNIYKADLDGSNTMILVDLGSLYNGWYGSSNSRAYGIVTHDAYMYWADGGPDKILRAAKDGSGVMELVDPLTAIGPGSYAPYGITTDGTYLYWVDGGTESIYKSNLDGTGVMTLTKTGDIGSTNPRYLAYKVDGSNAVTVSQVTKSSSLALVFGLMVLGAVVVLSRLRKR